MIPCILTGYDEKYEAFAAYWLMKIRRNSNWPVFVCDFGFSESHRNWLEDRKVTVYKSASTETGWFLKPFAIRDCPARFGVDIDIDAEAMLDLSGFQNHIADGKISVATDQNDVHYYSVIRPLNGGVIAFDNKSKAIQQWCDSVCERRIEKIIHEKKGDQGYLNLCVDRVNVLELPRRFNWFDDINNVDAKSNPEAVVWHHLGPMGKQRFMRRSNEIV